MYLPDIIKNNKFGFRMSMETIGAPVTLLNMCSAGPPRVPFCALPLKSGMIASVFFAKTHAILFYSKFATSLNIRFSVASTIWTPVFMNTIERRPPDMRFCTLPLKFGVVIDIIPAQTQAIPLYSEFVAVIYGYLGNPSAIRTPMSFSNMINCGPPYVTLGAFPLKRGVGVLVFFA